MKKINVLKSLFFTIACIMSLATYTMDTSGEQLDSPADNSLGAGLFITMAAGPACL